MCDRLEPLGVKVAMREYYPQELEPAEFYALRYADTPGQQLSPLHLVLVAGHPGMDVNSAHSALGRLERCGIIARPNIVGFPEFIPTSKDLTTIDVYLSVFDPVEMRRGKLQKSPFIEVVQIVTGRGGWEAKSTARNLAPFAAPTESVTSVQLVEIAYQMDVTIAESMQKISEVYDEARLPVVDDECSALTVPPGVYTALLRGFRRDPKWRQGPLGIVAGALFLREPLGDFLRRLDKFRPLGAPVPPYDEGVRLMLNEIYLDDYDADMLTTFDEFGVERELRAINALSFIQIAGRLGWTLAQAHQRFARLVPIGLVLEYPTAVEFPDEIVYWYDLQVLTTYFDGQQPVISGRIDWAYLEKAAEEIFDCSPEEIPKKALFLRDRLRIYAPLFELELPEEAASA